MPSLRRNRRVATAELTRVRIEAYLRARAVHEGGDHAPGVDPLVAEEAARFVADRAGDDEVAHLVAEAESILAQCALEDGEPRRAEELFTSAADRCVAAGCTWEAVEPLARRAALLFARGDAAAAEVSARTAVEHADDLTDPEEQAAVRLTLADVLLRRGEHPDEAASYALEAAHWFDHAGLSEAGGAQARLVLARSYATTDRTAEAAEVLQSALPDLLEHGEPQAVSARETLGDLLLQLNGPRGAAEQYLQAADVAEKWDDPRPQAQLAHGAAEALSRAGLRSEAESAYGRSLELWRRAGGEPVAEARVLRSLAWLAVDHDHEDEDDEDEETAEYLARAEEALTRARAFMREALESLEARDDADAPQLRYERGQTWRQLADLLVLHVEDELGYVTDEENDSDTTAARAAELQQEAVELWTRAAEVFADLGPEALQDRFASTSRACWTEHGLGRKEAALFRMESLAADLHGREEATSLTSQVQRALDGLRS